MIDEIDREALLSAENEDEGDRRQLVFWLLWALLIFLVIFGCGQIAIWFGSSDLDMVNVESGLTVDYGIWTPVAFGGLNPLIIAEAADDSGGVIYLASDPSDSCFLLNCTPAPPSPTATPTTSPTATPTPTDTPTPTSTPTASNTAPPTFTFTPVYTPTNTPTPTPRVYPVKIANPYKIPPGPAPVPIDFEIMVINWGSIPPAELTLICDFLPSDMAYISGSADQGGTFGPCPDPDGILTGPAVFWQFSPPLIIAQGGFTWPSFTFQANAQNTFAGQVLTNEVRTWGDNIETAVFYRPVYVFTPTPTSTPVGAPTAFDDFYSVDEDTALVISNPSLPFPTGGVLGNDIDLLWNGLPDTLEVTVVSGPANGSLALNLDGTFTYTPNLNYYSPPGIPDTFTYQACDQGALCDNATVEITVNSIPDVPVANDDVYTVGEDSVLTIPGPLGLEVIDNDTDGDGDPLTVDPTPVVDATQFLVLNDTGGFSYNPGGIYNGSDTFTYRVCDSSPCSSSVTSSDTAIVTINVTPLNDAPVLDFLGSMSLSTIDEDEVNSTGGLVSAIIASAGGDRITDVDVGAVEGIAVISVVDTNGEWQYDIGGGWTAFGPVANNSAVLLADTALVRFVPDLDYHGASTISFRAWDQTSGNNGDSGVNASPNGGTTAFSTAIEIATITINSIDDFPLPQDDNVSTNEDTPITISVLVNDWMGNNPPPAPGDGFGSVVVTTPPVNGTTVVNGDNTITYSPDLNYFSPGSPVVPDVFTYRLCDADLDCNTATVTVTVISVNDPPVADNDSATLAEDSIDYSIDVVDGDTDVDGTIDVASVVVTSGPSNGTAVANLDGTVDYTPNADYRGPDSFTYTVDDDQGATSNTATVDITVDPVNDVPVAVSNDYSTDEDITLNVAVPGVLGNDTGIGDIPLTLIVVSGPSNAAPGGLTLNDDGSFSYTPAADWFGTDSFDYTITDSGLLLGETSDTSPAATVTIIVNPVNDPPVAIDDPQAPTLYEVDEDDVAGLTVTALDGVLANDTDTEGDPLTAVLDADVSDGTLTLNADGSFDYVPDPDFRGTDTFTYHANDGADDSNIATVTITIYPQNDTPIAVGDAYSTDEDVTLNVAASGVLGNDSGLGDTPLTLNLESGPTNAAPGGFTLNNDGSFSYTPAADWSGTDSFDYTITDSSAQPPETSETSNQVTVTITVNAVNDPPVAVDDPQSPTLYEVDEDYVAGLSVAAPGVLGNDSDAEGDPLTAVLDADVSDGTLTLNADGSFDYVPDADFRGTDTFTYHANDGIDDSNIATVTITINPQNDIPVAVDGPSYFVSEDVYLIVPFMSGVLVNDTGLGDTPLTLTLVAGPSNAWLFTLDQSGGFGYLPTQDFFGTDSFVYTITDSGALSGENADTSLPATVTITVNEVNDPPTAVDDDDGDGAFVNEDESVTIDVLANDFDGDPLPDPLTVQSVTDPPNGSVVNNGTDVTYSPDADFYGTDTFDYTVSDGRGGTDTATVTVRVDPVNDTPVAVDDGGPFFNVNEDVALMMFHIPGVLGNDSGIGDTPLTLTVVSGPSDGGLLNLGNNGGFGYLPAFDYNGITTFDYQVCDSDPVPECDVATVTINVNPVDDQPDAVDDVTSTGEDVPIAIDVLANDPMGNNAPPAPGDGMGSLTKATDPSNGTAAVNNNGTPGDPTDDWIDYSPLPNWSGVDSFMYTLCDADPIPDCDTATVTVTVNEVNDPPTAVNDDDSDGAFVDEDSSVTIDVLANDFDGDPIPDPLSVQSVTDPPNGTAVNNGTDVTYAPDADFNGIDTFDYTVSDGRGGTDTATVTVRVDSLNDSPIAVDDSVSTDEDTAITIDVLANDPMGNNPPPAPGDGLGSVAVTLDPLNGSANVSGNSIIYTPSLDYFSPPGTPDTFEYTVCDVDGPPDCDTATVTVTVNSVNDPPVAGDDSATLNEDTSINIDVTANDSDVDGTVDDATVAVTSGPSNGTAVANLDGTVDYTPNTDYRGPDSFTYTVDDDLGATSLPATVSITVDPVNDIPVAVGNSYSTDEDVTLNVSAPGVLGNDSGLGDTPLTLNVVSGPSNAAPGGFTLNNDGSFSYTPAADWFGMDSFDYTITDSGLLLGETSDTSPAVTVTITVNSINDPPVAVTDSYNVDEDTLTPLVVAAPGVLTNDYDVDGDPFSPTLVSGVSNGTLAFASDGSFTYMPNSNFNGTDSFTYEICDPSPACSSTDVTIVVNPVPDPQTFISLSPSDVTLNPNESFTFDILFGNRGPGTAYGVVITGAVGGDCTLLTPNPIITSGSMAEGVGLLTTASIQANASGSGCTFTATISSTNGTPDSDTADISISGSAMWGSPSSPAMASTSSGGAIEAAIAFLVPVSMLISPLLLSWLGKVKRFSRSG